MLVAIHQPHYLAWLRYYEKIARCERFIVLDDVEFTRNGWQNRNRIRTAQGPVVLTVPVKQKLHQKINEVETASSGWCKKHWKTLQQNYSAARYFETYRSDLERWYSREHTHLSQLCMEQIQFHVQALGIQTPLLRSSESPTELTASERLVELVRRVGGTAYLTGRYALGEYLDPAVFSANGIDLFIFEWQSPRYPQLWPKREFEPDLATLDLLLNTGGEESAALLRSGSRVVRYER